MKISLCIEGAENSKSAAGPVTALYTGVVQIEWLYIVFFSGSAIKRVETPTNEDVYGDREGSSWRARPVVTTLSGTARQ
ncbi:hypothetical protein HN018_25295 (plasmid) [Lichenicola cladoniae]|uniref:Uncharacterized protein n=1 Tax=Lichenicola cladoniae TaxID=1484109 RepID=A0A6M8HZ02_9PROT|nr:hypothetical protein [Lichenicola cladoniae]NPD66820.1 hypothetical protein [Acetobacteraceae bacterium]QKE93486.1 hypothetical protein HN018_25295 [Lichenicola cladoniae]